MDGFPDVLPDSSPEADKKGGEHLIISRLPQQKVFKK
jgi:hypothetical protein